MNVVGVLYITSILITLSQFKLHSAQNLVHFVFLQNLPVFGIFFGLCQTDSMHIGYNDKIKSTTVTMKQRRVNIITTTIALSNINENNTSIMNNNYNTCQQFHLIQM